MRGTTTMFATILLAIGSAVPASRAADPLPSWNEGSAKKAIVDFIERVTDEAGKDFVPIPERIAVFDNDGTLWPENPVPFQFAFALDSLKRTLPTKPELKDDPAVKAALSGDTEALLADGHKGLLRCSANARTGQAPRGCDRRRRPVHGEDWSVERIRHHTG